jgi:tRNA (guanine37-N1)-methyltransferase
MKLIFLNVEPMMKFTNKTNPFQTLPLTGQGLDKNKTRVVMMSARGEKFDQAKAEELSKLENLVILAGHYEGFDQRISDYMIDEEISIGDYVLTGGELPAMILIDAVTRLIPRVLGKDESSKTESWSEIEIDGQKLRTMEYPQYTRPREFMGKTVPEVLLSGDPKKIKQWQLEQIKKTTR